jgi:hypothetical protein
VPNRVRPFQYKDAFERNGWVDVQILPQLTLSGNIDAYSGMSEPFAERAAQMEYLSFTLCARRQ